MGIRIALFLCLVSVTFDCAASSLNFVTNNATNVEHARQLSIPAAFGSGEFTMELWIKPNHQLPIGPTNSDSEKLSNWATADNRPYGSYSWWYNGNFLLDGFSNAGDFSGGTFALQFYGGGRVRWLLGDGSNIVGGVRSVGAYPASGTPHLLDGRWHQLTLVRRWIGTSGAQLELWIDGTLIDTEAATRTNMRQWWDNWYGFPSNQRGWFWGAEKQAALGSLVWEDYRGLLDELRFWSRAKSTNEIQTTWNQRVFGGEAGLVGWYAFGETGGSSVCDTIAGACMSLHRTTASTFAADEAPTGGGGAGTGGVISLNAASYSGAEGTGNLTVTATRTGGSAGSATVSFATSDGTAVQGADYAPAFGTLSWAAGESGSRTFQVGIVDDQQPESNETLSVNLSNATGATLGTPSTATIAIPANDQTSPPPQPPPPPTTTWSDDFSRADGSQLANGWIEKTPAAFAIVGGQVTKSATTTDWRDNLVYRPSSEDLRDVVASLEFRLTSSSVGWPGIIVRAQPGTIAMPARWDGYLLYLNNSRTQAVLARQSGTGWDTVLAYVNLSGNIDSTRTHRLRLRAVGTSPVQLNAYVEVWNGSAWQVLGQASYADSSSARFASAGSVGFAAHTYDTHVFDNFRVERVQ